MASSALVSPRRAVSPKQQQKQRQQQKEEALGILQVIVYFFSRFCSYGFKIAVVFFVLAISWKLNQEEEKTASIVHTTNNFQKVPSSTLIAPLSNDDDGIQNFLKLVRSQVSNRCVDGDDPVDWNEAAASSYCHCIDPFVPEKRTGKNFDRHHDQLVRDAALAIEWSAEAGPLDLVMIGDSIIERWNGTRSAGKTPAPEFHDALDSHFTTTTKRNYDNNSHHVVKPRVATFGTSGDTTNNLLWHLENGMLPKDLQPNAWLIMIGTNNLGRTECSKRNTLAGMLAIAQLLDGHSNDNNSSISGNNGSRKKSKGSENDHYRVPIILHALMPRNDVFVFGKPATDFSLGKRWTQILWINEQLKKACEQRPNHWVYLNVNDKFLKETAAAADKLKNESRKYQFALEIDPLMMDDALHPNVKGYNIWGEIIAETLKAPPFKAITVERRPQ